MTLSNENALITNMTSDIVLRFAPGTSRDTAAPQVEDNIAIEVGRLLDDVRRTLNHDLSAAKTSAARLATFLASKAALNARPAPARGGLAPWQKRRVQNHIEEGLDGPLLVEDLAGLVSLSPSYFCRAFKESFGIPPHAYIIKMRVARARTLMLTTSESLSQIALACGLVDQAHLCKCFRQAMGTTPAAWRRSHITAPQSTGPMAIVNPASACSPRRFPDETTVSP
jgi:AraC family transcriptional regulator